MDGKRLELQIQDSSAPLGYFHFDVEGEWSPRLEPVYNVGNPPVLAQIREVWEFVDARVKSTDDTTDTLWSVRIAALRSAIEQRTAHPTFVRLVRNPRATGEAVVITLGPPDYEDLRIETVEGGQDPDAPDVSWSRTGTFTITVSAVKKLPDAVTGIVTFEQRATTTFRFGLRTLEWRTTITTKEGVSAVAKAKLFGRLPDALLAGDHAFQTNGPDGIDIEELDSDETQGSTARVTTAVVAVSRIEQFGEPVNATTAGNSPDFFQFFTEVRKKADTEETVFFARAQGPNSASYVASKKPGGSLAVDIEHIENTSNLNWGHWEKHRNTQAGPLDEFKIRVTPGAQVELLRTLTGIQPADRSIGGFTWWDCVVEISSFLTGSEEIDFPGLLPKPWVLNRAQVVEGSPEVVGERKKDIEDTRFVRQVTLPYRAITKPKVQGHLATVLLAQLRFATRVQSYALD